MAALLTKSGEWWHINSEWWKRGGCLRGNWEFCLKVLSVRCPPLQWMCPTGRNKNVELRERSGTQTHTGKLDGLSLPSPSKTALFTVNFFLPKTWERDPESPLSFKKWPLWLWPLGQHDKVAVAASLHGVICQGTGTAQFHWRYVLGYNPGRSSGPSTMSGGSGGDALEDRTHCKLVIKLWGFTNIDRTKQELFFFFFYRNTEVKQSRQTTSSTGT